MESIYTALSQWKGVGNSELVEGRFMAASLVYDLGVEWLWNALLVGTAGSSEELVPECLRATPTQSTMSKIGALYKDPMATTAVAAQSSTPATPATWATILTIHIQTHYLSTTMTTTPQSPLPSEIVPLVDRLAAIVRDMYEGVLVEMNNNINAGKVEDTQSNKLKMAVWAEVAAQCDAVPPSDIKGLLQSLQSWGDGIGTEKSPPTGIKSNKSCTVADTAASAQSSETWALRPPVPNARLLGALLVLKSNCAMALQSWLEKEAQHSLYLDVETTTPIFTEQTVLKSRVVPLILQASLAASCVAHFANTFVHDHGTSLLHEVSSEIAVLQGTSSTPAASSGNNHKNNTAILFQGNAEAVSFLMNLYLKSSFRQGRLYEWLAILEEGQVLESCIIAATTTAVSSGGGAAVGGKAASLPMHVGQACQRWYQWRLKAWNTTRDAAVVTSESMYNLNGIKDMIDKLQKSSSPTSHIDHIRQLLRSLLLAQKPTLSENEEQQQSIDDFFFNTAIQQQLVRQQGEIASDATRLQNQILRTRASSISNPLEAYSGKIMPYSSRIHGVGIVSVDAIDEGEALIVECPVVKSTSTTSTSQGESHDDAESKEAGSYQGRFVGAVRNLKALTDLAKMEASNWSKKVAAACLNNNNSKTIPGDSLLSALLSYAPPPAGRSTRVPPPPSSLYTLLSLLALHSKAPTANDNDDANNNMKVDKNTSASVAPADVGMNSEDTLLCGVWHNNAMRIDEVDFRVGSGSPTDAFNGSGELSGDPGSGLFLSASRLNHSHNRPNAICIFDHLGTGHLTVRALTKIPAGKEIFISYAPIIGSYLQRKKHLRFPVREIKKKSTDKTAAGEEENVGGMEPAEVEDNIVVLDDEEETTEDVLAPHMTGQEQLTCPKCGINIEGRRESETVRMFSCKVCKTPIPIADYYERINERRDQAIAWCSSGDSAQRSKALKLLLGVEEGAKMLHVHHYLRFQIRLEALAAGVGAQLTLELSDKLVTLSKQLAERAEDVCPLGWPLTTGLRMHYIYALGRHRIGTGESIPLKALLERTREAISKKNTKTRGAVESSGGSSLADKRERLKQRRKEKRDEKAGVDGAVNPTTSTATTTVTTAPEVVVPTSAIVPPTPQSDGDLDDTRAPPVNPTTYMVGPDGVKVPVDLPTGLNLPDDAPPEDVNVTLLRYLFLSVQDHLNQYGVDAAMKRFFDRYSAELEAIDIHNPSDLESALTVASTTL